MGAVRLGVLSRHAAALVLGLVAASSAIGQEKCFTCHPAPGLAARIAQDRHTTPQAEEIAFKGDAHAQLKCTDCHRQAATVPHPSAMQPAQCQSCHTTIRSHVLGHDRPELKDKVPNCVGCHGYHVILRPDNHDSPVSRRNVPALCMKCHGGTINSPFGYSQSVHGQAHAEALNSPAAVCTDCHSAHPTEKGGNLLSLVSHARMPGTCGKCHRDVLKVYRQSIHGRAVAADEAEAAVCTDCHGEHNILPPGNPESQVSPQRVSQTCAKCHANETVIRIRGLPADRVTSYEASYHGIANRFGSLTAANCVSCHGAHEIRPSSDLESSINPSNLPKTCGKCHGDVSRNIARGQIHLEVSRAASPIVYWVAFGFRWLTILTMAGLSAHIILDLAKKMKQRREVAKGGELR